MIRTIFELRREFWRQHPNTSRRRITSHSGTGWMYTTDARVSFCDFVDLLARAGDITPALAQRATLGGAE